MCGRSNWRAAHRYYKKVSWCLSFECVCVRYVSYTQIFHDVAPVIDVNHRRKMDLAAAISRCPCQCVYVSAANQFDWLAINAFECIMQRIHKVIAVGYREIVWSELHTLPLDIAKCDTWIVSEWVREYSLSMNKINFDGCHWPSNPFSFVCHNYSWTILFWLHEIFHAKHQRQCPQMTMLTTLTTAITRWYCGEQHYTNACRHIFVCRYLCSCSKNGQQIRWNKK